MVYQEDLTDYANQVDSGNFSFVPTGLEAVANTRLEIHRILVSAYDVETLILKDGTTEKGRLYLGVNGTGGIDYGNKPLKLSAGNAFTLAKVLSASTPISVMINYKRYPV